MCLCRTSLSVAKKAKQRYCRNRWPIPHISYRLFILERTLPPFVLDESIYYCWQRTLLAWWSKNATVCYGEERVGGISFERTVGLTQFHSSWESFLGSCRKNGYLVGCYRSLTDCTTPLDEADKLWLAVPSPTLTFCKEKFSVTVSANTTTELSDLSWSWTHHR